QKHLLRFIKSRLKHNGDLAVMKDENGKDVSLSQLFERLNLTSYDLSIDLLNMHGHRQTFHRFDRFNAKYNPIGEPTLRQVFLKVENHIKGRFLAEVTREVFDDLKESKYQYTEYRLSIYGKAHQEWDVLASWVCTHKLHCPNVRWMIQIPRLFSVYRQSKIVNNFGDMLDNIFRPLFEVTVNPQSHMELDLFLKLVVGFDSVDDESIQENSRYKDLPLPNGWNSDENPPYILWCYYLYANIYVLNKLREAKGMNAFAFRPHSGEAGDIDHVASTFLLAHAINHGLTLKKAPVLQYLYYLKQVLLFFFFSHVNKINIYIYVYMVYVGISMSPLSNNLLFIEYDKNPFPSFFQRGLNVTLSTDDPLLIHYTKDPLIEEYAIAAQVYKLSAIDMCEIARNSVLQCGFPEDCKRHWIGKKYYQRGPAGNNINQTNVPDIRLRFRDELLKEEENWILGSFFVYICLPPPIFPSSFTQQYKVMMTKAPKSLNRKRLSTDRTKEKEVRDDTTAFPKRPTVRHTRAFSLRDVLGERDAGILGYPRQPTVPGEHEAISEDAVASTGHLEKGSKYDTNKQITVQGDSLSYMNLFNNSHRQEPANSPQSVIRNVNVADYSGRLRIPLTERVLSPQVESEVVENDPPKEKRTGIVSYDRTNGRVSLSFDVSILTRKDVVLVAMGLTVGYGFAKFLTAKNGSWVGLWPQWPVPSK
ncbi:AMP deaminase, partial [Reticulomyxa filosa]